MSTNYKVLVIDTTSSPPAPPQVTLEELRDAILNHPTLALDALRFALQQGPTPSATPASPPSGTGGTAVTSPQFGDLPLDTPIFKMLSADQAKLLTPTAAKLTKEDLLDLAGVGPVKKTAQLLNLTIDDLKSIQDAFHEKFSSDVAAGLLPEKITISRCCCTPCCCCTAVALTDAYRRVA
jgi:hypothetical protein